MQEITAKLAEGKGVHGVYVPRRCKTKQCEWKCGRSKDMVFMPFDILVDIGMYSLDNAFIKLADGTILRQREGIPMGDPVSPGLTIGTCAYMEDNFMRNIEEETKQFFKTKRYLDDVLIVTADNKKWDSVEFRRQIETKCYEEPLKLTPGNEKTYLETSFTIEDNTIRYCLKNDNIRTPGKIWRYALVDSHTPYAQKKATITATLTKVHKMASDNGMRRASAIQKLKEFKELGYTRSSLRQACTRIWLSTGDATWMDVKQQF